MSSFSADVSWQISLCCAKQKSVWVSLAPCPCFCPPQKAVDKDSLEIILQDCIQLHFAASIPSCCSTICGLLRWLEKIPLHPFKQVAKLPLPSLALGIVKVSAPHSAFGRSASPSADHRQWNFSPWHPSCQHSSCRPARAEQGCARCHQEIRQSVEAGILQTGRNFAEKHFFLLPFFFFFTETEILQSKFCKILLI